MKCPTSIDLMAATVNGNVMVDRFLLDPGSAQKVVRLGKPDSAQGKHIMSAGVRAAGFTGIRLAELAKACGIGFDPSKLDILPSDGPLFMLALMAKYDGRLWAAPTDSVEAKAAAPLSTARNHGIPAPGSVKGEGVESGPDERDNT